MASNPITEALIKTVAELQGRASMMKIGQHARNVVVRRTRQGFGVDREGANKRKFKPLKAGTITNRARFTGLNQFTRPSFANLTRTGAMLDDIKPKVRRNVIEISATSSLQKDKVSGHTFGIQRTNVPRRPFLALSKAEERQVTNFVCDEFQRILDKNVRNL